MQYHDILPLFIQDPMVTIFVLKLLEELSHRPTIEYYGAGEEVRSQGVWPHRRRGVVTRGVATQEERCGHKGCGTYSERK